LAYEGWLRLSLQTPGIEKKFPMITDNDGFTGKVNYINSTHDEPLNNMPDFDKHRLNDFWTKDPLVTKPDAFYFRITK